MDREAGLLDSETVAQESPGSHKDELRLWLRLLTCTTLIETEIRRRLRERFDVTLPRFDLMAQLDKAPSGMILSDLSRRMMVSNGNLTALVERLVEGGQIERRASTSDRRIQIVSLTRAGRREFRRMASAHGDWIAELTGGLAPDEIAQLMGLLGKLKMSARAGAAEREKP